MVSLFLKSMLKEDIKNTGATFTPWQLADYLSEKILSYLPSAPLNILDPACGDGALLSAIGKKLSAKNINFSLKGFDTNDFYLSQAAETLRDFKPNPITLIQGDFLDTVHVIDHNSSQLSLFGEKNTATDILFDVVIANPPYVRTQILGTEQAQAMAKKFGLKGRVDLYYPFLIAMTQSLKEGGLIGVITSNRYLSTKSGDSIRKFLSANFEILELIDLGDTKLFDAAVLPAIFIGRKTRLQPFLSTAKFSRIYEELNGYKGDLMPKDSIYDIISDENTGYYTTNGKRYKKTTGILKYEMDSASNWELLSDIEANWVNTIDKNSKNKVEDFFKVRVGIKTTADSVFIRDDWGDLGDAAPENEVLKDLISQENIEEWKCSENKKLKILYPHYSRDGVKHTIDISQYPKASKYLNKYKDQLSARKYLIDAGRKWYEIWVPHKPNYWSLPKLVFPDISLYPRFYFDQEGKLVNGNCYWIVAHKPEDIERLLLIQGIANSKLMTKYHDLVFQNKLYSGRRRYFTQYVEKYPLPNINSISAKNIIEIASQLNMSNDDLIEANLKKELEIQVAYSFGVPPVFNLD
ncbi:MAG: hypothetical protein RIR11_1191 [Bacteroidota bacterium]